jgi:hypothetical protein
MVKADAPAAHEKFQTRVLSQKMMPNVRLSINFAGKGTLRSAEVSSKPLVVSRMTPESELLTMIRKKLQASKQYRHLTFVTGTQQLSALTSSHLQTEIEDGTLVLLSTQTIASPPDQAAAEEGEEGEEGEGGEAPPDDGAAPDDESARDNHEGVDTEELCDSTKTEKIFSQPDSSSSSSSSSSWRPVMVSHVDGNRAWSRTPRCQSESISARMLLDLTQVRMKKVDVAGQDTLPIHRHRQEILVALSVNQIVLISGDTGISSTKVHPTLVCNVIFLF